MSNAACYWANIPLCTVSAAHISLSQIAPPMPSVQCLQLPIDNITAIKTMTAHHQQAPTTTTALWETWQSNTKLKLFLWFFYQKYNMNNLVKTEFLVDNHENIKWKHGAFNINNKSIKVSDRATWHCCYKELWEGGEIKIMNSFTIWQYSESKFPWCTERFWQSDIIKHAVRESKNNKLWLLPFIALHFVFRHDQVSCSSNIVP